MIVKECHAIMVFRREELGCAININTINISEDVGEWQKDEKLECLNSLLRTEVLTGHIFEVFQFHESTNMVR